MSAYAPRLGPNLFGLAVGLLMAAVVGAAVWMLLASAPTPVPADEADGTSLSTDRAYAELPLAFEPNAGRFDPAIDFTAKAQSGSVALSERGAVLSQASDAIAVRFPGADLSDATATDKLPGVVNDLRGDDPSKHVTNLPTYGGVTYSNIAPGVDLDFYGKGTALEYDFRLAPGVDPATAQTRIAGADDLHLNASGDLVATVNKTRFVQNAPVTFQPATATEPKRAVESKFVLDGDRVSFDLGDYDPSRALVIDPVQLAYSTYLGGTEAEQANAVAVDSFGSAYVTGDTNSPDFNTVNPIETDQPGYDIFVSKFEIDGDALEYSTYLGGEGYEQAYDIAIDSGGSAYITGETDSIDFNTANPFEPDSQGEDAFVSKLTRDGDSLAYSTYIGGNGFDRANDIAVDAFGAAYVAGETESFNFPTFAEIEGDSPGTDAFVAKFESSGEALAYSTYLGGGDFDSGRGLAIDDTGAAYVSGFTGSSDFDTVDPIEGDSIGGDVFVSKLTPSGDGLDYSTYLGGNASESGDGIAVDSEGAAYVTGVTGSGDFDTAAPFQRDRGDDDAFVSKIAPAGDTLEYSTYLGGSLRDAGNDIDVDESGKAYVTGFTTSDDFPVKESLPAGGGGDAFVTRLAVSGSELGFSTSLGGGALDAGNGIAVGQNGSAYVVGSTVSDEFPTENPIEEANTLEDAFVSKLVLPPRTRITGKPAKTIKTRKRKVRVTFRFTPSEPGEIYACSIDNEDPIECASPVTYVVGLGKHRFRVAGGRGGPPASYSFTVKKKRKRRG